MIATVVIVTAVNVAITIKMAAITTEVIVIIVIYDKINAFKKDYFNKVYWNPGIAFCKS